MRKRALRFLVLLTGLLKVVLLDKDILVETVRTWMEARRYCRAHHTDLSSIYNLKDDRLDEKRGTTWKPNVWIGLHREDNGPWKWSDGREATVFNWTAREDHAGQNGCVSHTKRGWKIKDCEDNRFFSYCFHLDLVLVKKTLTWERARQHCVDLKRQLVSVDSEPALNHFLRVISDAQTTRVWTGLRYLGGSWVWMEEEEIWYNAWGEEGEPRCPGMIRRCGAVSKGVARWESWDCTDELNFVCH